MSKKVVIVTGASSGIGKALSLEYINKEYNVVLAARNLEKLQNVVKDLPTTNYLLVQTDVTQDDQCQALMNTTIEKFGRLDVLINNAGISMRALFKDLQVDVLKQVMEVNFWGMVYCTKAAMPHLLASKGTVVGISSIAGYRGLPGRTGYSASKFAMNGFLEALRTENLKTGVNVLTASPGFTASAIREKALSADGSNQGESPRDEGKMMTAEEVAQHIFKAVEKRKRTLILTRQGKLTVFLNKWMPGKLDNMVFNHMAKEDDSPFK
ncbi:MAG: SDR family oxidoreductase [Saprospiraceae bacterium]|nr:SDR family oxidoreductase [Saprospiraceae bacterium]